MAMIVAWIVLGVIAAALSSSIFKKPARFGETTEFAIGIVTSVAIGLIDREWALPAFGIEGVMAYVILVAEPFLAALGVLWLTRQFK